MGHRAAVAAPGDGGLGRPVHGRGRHVPRGDRGRTGRDLTDSSGAHLSHLRPPGEPERYIHWLASDRRFKGRGAGAALLAHAAGVTREAGVSLLRVDCYAGGDGKLVAYYEGNGFVRTESFTHGENAWPGQVLARRVR